MPINNKVRAAVRESLDDPNAIKVFALFDWLGEYTSPIAPPAPTYATEATDIIINNFDAMFYDDISIEELAEMIYNEGNAVLEAGAANAS